MRKKCINHHHACDCREERMRLLEKVAVGAKKVSTLLENNGGFSAGRFPSVGLMNAALHELAALDALGQVEVEKNTGGSIGKACPVRLT